MLETIKCKLFPGTFSRLEGGSEFLLSGIKKVLLPQGGICIHLASYVYPGLIPSHFYFIRILKRKKIQTKKNCYGVSQDSHKLDKFVIFIN